MKVFRPFIKRIGVFRQTAALLLRQRQRQQEEQVVIKLPS
jgi:hypothetical protein